MPTSDKHPPAIPERQPTPADGVISDQDVEVSRIKPSVADATGDTAEPILDPAASEEITGRAAGTDEDLTSLFKNPGQDHLGDGFKGGSGADEESG